MSGASAKNLRLTQLSLMIALEAVLFFTPLGLIVIPPISMTTMHIPVIITAILLGPMAGATLGTAFGLMALAKATLSAVTPIDMMFSPFLSGNPLASIVMCVLARVALGVIAALVYKAITPFIKNNALAIGITAVVATIAHTMMVLGCLSLFFSALPLKQVFAAILTLNCGVESVAAAVLAVGVVIPLQKMNNHHQFTDNND